MGLEGGGGRWERPRRPQMEIREILNHPEGVFDSSLREAERSSRQVMEDLKERGSVDSVGAEVECRIEKVGLSQLPPIQIAWPITDTSSYLLRLQPIQFGRGIEARDVIAYKGSYGTAKKDGSEWKFESQTSLEELFGVPDELEVYVKPSIDRWAVGKDELADIFGDNARTLYMGLGFLFLGHQWMHIGMHEAGHLPDKADENEAWFRGNKLYASRHKKDKDAIMQGKNTGQFELLEKPVSSSQRKPTIGKIMQYGLVSHFIGGTKIPKHWKAQEIMKEFQLVIQRAHKAYEKIIL